MDLNYAKEHATPTSQRVSLIASSVSVFVVIVMAVIFTSHYIDYAHVADTVREKHLTTPHYRGDHGMEHCDDCHDYPTDKCDMHTVGECLDCHKEDGKARILRYRSVLVLCTRCHTDEVFVAYEKDGNWHEVDITHNHPYGMELTELTYPKTLPVDERGIICTTCHDVHTQDTDRKMLRLYLPKLKPPSDVTPLCLDCHHENGIL